MPIVYLNGEFIPQQDAKVSVMDRGFLFGDGIYEVVPVFSGKMFGEAEHLKRLERSLSAVFIQSPLSADEWHQVFIELLKRNPDSNQQCNIYLQITRGAGDTRDHHIPTDIQPTVVAFLTPRPQKSRSTLNQGFKAITTEDSRRRDCHIKAIALLPNILLYREAKQAGAVEAILTRDGYAIEGTSSNLFVIKDQTIFTPPLSPNILGGITRNLILTLAKHHHIAYQETPIAESLLHDADEIWVTGSSKEILPIVQLDDQLVGNGKVGPMWQKMMDYYEEQKANEPR